MSRAERTYPIGTVVRHVQSGVEGTIVGKPVAMRSAGGAVMQRVRWHHQFRPRPEGSFTFVRDLEEA